MLSFFYDIVLLLFVLTKAYRRWGGQVYISMSFFSLIAAHNASSGSDPHGSRIHFTFTLHLRYYTTSVVAWGYLSRVSNVLSINSFPSNVYVMFVEVFDWMYSLQDSFIFVIFSQEAQK